VPWSRNVSPAIYSLGVRCLSRALAASPPPARPFTGPAPLTQNRSVPEPCGFSASPGVLAPTNATTSGAPCFSPVRPESRPGGRGLPHPRRCRPQGSCPSRRFRPFRTRLARTLADPPFVRRGAPTLRGLVPCRSRPWNVPAELSLPEEPYPLSRALLLPCVSSSDRRRRSAARTFATAFPARADFFAAEPRRSGTRDA
jgi:hypothetical protein